MTLKVAECRAHLTKEQFARKLHGHLRRITTHARDQRHFHDLEGFAFFVCARLHGRGDRTHAAVRHQEAEKGANQCRAHFGAEFRARRLGHRCHGIHNAKDRCDDTKAR